MPAAFDDARRWLDGPVNAASTGTPGELGVDPSHFNDVLSPVAVERLSLVSRDREDRRDRQGAARRADLEGFAAPFGLMLLLGMIVLVGSAPMLTAVTEDKAQRIVEMLLGLATPFELMMGKVLAAVGVSLTSSAFYVVGGRWRCRHWGWSGMVPFSLLPWFYVYLVADVVMLCAFAAALGRLQQPAGRPESGGAAGGAGDDPVFPADARHAAAQRRASPRLMSF